MFSLKKKYIWGSKSNMNLAFTRSFMPEKKLTQYKSDQNQMENKLISIWSDADFSNSHEFIDFYAWKVICLIQSQPYVKREEKENRSIYSCKHKILKWLYERNKICFRFKGFKLFWNTINKYHVTSNTRLYVLSLHCFPSICFFPFILFSSFIRFQFAILLLSFIVSDVI